MRSDPSNATTAGITRKMEKVGGRLKKVIVEKESTNGDRTHKVVHTTENLPPPLLLPCV